jgi:NhaA family Na+:H+ antiporter
MIKHFLFKTLPEAIPDAIDALPKVIKAPLPISTIRRFLRNEAAGGYILMAAAALAMAVANSPMAQEYDRLLHSYYGGLSVLHWINDGLMALFFLLVGLEIKREMVDGQMASWPRRILPGAAALGGMLVPALVYLAINRHSPGTLNGWAVPAATDIAFALGVLALLGDRVPGSLKLLLTAIAIIDDLGAIIIIAIFYTASLNIPALIAAAALLAVLIGFNRCKVQAVWPYLAVGLGVWFATLESGIHATLAGVAVAMTIPLRRNIVTRQDNESPLLRLEHKLEPLSAYVIVPIFGFANAGVSLSGLTFNDALQPVPIGIALGLLVGKQIGVFGTIFALVKSGIVSAPARATMRQIWGLSVLCGIGFTMSLFIAGLAFGEGSDMNTEAKIGIVCGSILSALLGWLILSGSRPEKFETAESA